MIVRSKNLYIILGNENTGKATLQTFLIERLFGSKIHSRLPASLMFEITHPEMKKKYRTVSFTSRSYQKKRDIYGSIDDFFDKHFAAADICFISSHLIAGEITQMITHAKQRFYNVNGVFLSNSIEKNASENSMISTLDWDERLVLENSYIDEDHQTIENNMNSIADNLVLFLINRANIS